VRDPDFDRRRGGRAICPGASRPSRPRHEVGRNVGLTNFERADPAQPIGRATLYYNDAAGIRAMAGAAAWNRSWPILPPPAASLISVGLKDQYGWSLPGLMVGDCWFVIGEEGRRYSVVVRNKSDLRLEIVLSVDGLDVLDGGKASVRKRGYIMAPRSQLKVEGFRQKHRDSRSISFRLSPRIVGE
jgi:hypothetical protein